MSKHRLEVSVMLGFYEHMIESVDRCPCITLSMEEKAIVTHMDTSIRRMQRWIDSINDMNCLNNESCEDAKAIVKLMNMIRKAITHKSTNSKIDTVGFNKLISDTEDSFCDCVNEYKLYHT